MAVFGDGDIRLLDRGYSCEDYCPTPDDFLAPFALGYPLAGMREEDGRTFYLFDAGDGCYEEYVAEDGYRFARVRGYETDGDGLVRLAWYSDISLIEPPPIPDEVMNLLAPLAGQ